MLKGQKVNIRPIDKDDLELFYKWTAEQECMGDFMGANMFYKDIYIESIKNSFSDYNVMYAIIEDKENKPIGIIDYHIQKNNQGIADIGMLIANPETRGKG
ncbi:MAG: GNAT family N-acetyltransferase, partial [Lutisporaceae bacterium]